MLQVLITLMVLVLSAPPAIAHDSGRSFSTWTVQQGRVRVVYSLNARDATRLAEAGLAETGLAETSLAETSLAELLAFHLDTRLTVLGDGEPCRLHTPSRGLTARRGILRIEMIHDCAGASRLVAVDQVLFDVAPSHIHFARVHVHVVAGEETIELLFTADRRRQVLVGPASKAKTDAGHGISFAAFIGLGFEHILAGWDHLAFLLSILLLCRRPKDVLWTVTGFTLGHSLTLGLAAAGHLRPDPAAVEALIGFTIALVGAENIAVATGSQRQVALFVILGLGTLIAFSASASSPTGISTSTLLGLMLFSVCYLLLVPSAEAARRFRPALTVLFGLIHGFGFAGVLRTIGLPTDGFLIGLLGFNLGVELGQLAVVALLSAIGALLFRWTRTEPRLLSDLLSAGLVGLGIYWFVIRVC